MNTEEPVGRIRFMDRQRVNLDGFAVENPELGLTALCSPHDPQPSLVVTDGRVTELDGVPEAEFDSIDACIARHGLDLSVADEAAILDVEPGAPLMAITRTTTDRDGEPIEFSRDLFRADRTRIVVRTEGGTARALPGRARVVELRAQAASR